MPMAKQNLIGVYYVRLVGRQEVQEGGDNGTNLSGRRPPSHNDGPLSNLQCRMFDEIALVTHIRVGNCSK